MTDYSQDWIGLEQKAALARHGYDPDAAASGKSGPPTTWESSPQPQLGGARITLRPWVCYLDDVRIDGHDGSWLDPGSSACIHCDYEGPNP